MDHFHYQEINTTISGLFSLLKFLTYTIMYLNIYGFELYILILISIYYIVNNTEFSKINVN